MYTVTLSILLFHGLATVAMVVGAAVNTFTPARAHG